MLSQKQEVGGDLIPLMLLFRWAAQAQDCTVIALAVDFFCLLKTPWGIFQNSISLSLNVPGRS